MSESIDWTVGVLREFGVLSSIQIIFDEYLGELTHQEMPASLLKYRGPYKNRRRTRWHRAHPPYYRATGRCLLIKNGRTLVCHPADAPLIRQALSQANEARRV